MKIKILSDSTCDLSQELLEKYDITLVADPIDMTARPSTWENSFYSGTVEKISAEMIYFTDGRVSCIHPNQNFFVEYSDSNPSNLFKGINVEDIQKGDKVYCNYLSDGIRGIIVVGD